MPMTMERRKAQRMTTYLPVRLRVESSGRYLETLAKDVSLSGMRCVLRDAPSVGEELALEVPLSIATMPVHASARVAWVRQLPETDQALVGLQFHDLLPADTLLLSTYLAHAPTGA